MKILSLMIGACLLSNGLYAQQYYGQNTFYNTFPMSSAEVTSGTPDRGYLYSFSNFNTVSTKLFSILQTNSLVALGTPNTFYNTYSISLNATTHFARNYGTQVVRAHNGTDYFVASCVSTTLHPIIPYGRVYLVWSQLDNLGQPIGSPGTNSPYILLSQYASSPGPVSVTRGHRSGEYFVCGSYMVGTTSNLYIVKINSAGVMWRKEYRRTGSVLAPTAILQSPTDTGEVVLTANVENAVQSYPFTNKPAWGAFFMKFAGANGALSSTKAFDNFRFESVSATKEGYLISGCKIHGTSPYYQPLMLEIKKTTNNVIWSSVFFNPVIGYSFTSALQRRNPQSGLLEYFGAVGTNESRDIVRLDSSAVLHAAGNNWYLFPAITTSAHPKAYMTFKNDGGTDNGFQLHGTQDASASSKDSRIVRAYFNGQHSAGPGATCIELQTVTVQSFITMEEAQLDLQTVTGSTTSAFCGTKHATVSITPYANCARNSVPGGSNARVGSVTSTNAESADAGVSALFPNPTSGNTYLRFNVAGNETAWVTLTDLTGRLLKTWKFVSEMDGEQERELDLRSLNLESGIYLIRTNIGSQNSDSKLIYKKE